MVATVDSNRQRWQRRVGVGGFWCVGFGSLISLYLSLCSRRLGVGRPAGPMVANRRWQGGDAPRSPSLSLSLSLPLSLPLSLCEVVKGGLRGPGGRRPPPFRASAEEGRGLRAPFCSTSLFLGQLLV